MESKIANSKSVTKHVSYSTVNLIKTFDDDDDDEPIAKDVENDEIVEIKKELENLSEEALLRQNIRYKDLRYLDDLNDEDFLNCIEGLKAEHKKLKLENRIFENFLRANEPNLLSGLNQAHQTIKQLELSHPIYPFVEEELAVLDSSMHRFSSQYLKEYAFSDKGPRINVSQRIDLVLRDIEVIEKSLKDFIKKSENTRFRLKAEIEESARRLVYVKKILEDFEQNIVIDAVDPITQRIPGEKFIWFILDGMKNLTLLAEKLRLRNNSLKVQYSKLKAMLLQKSELGESVHEVDFEQYRIANQHLLEKIEEKNIHLMELKKINGKANLNLSVHKNYLQSIINKMKAVKNAIEEVILQKAEHERELIITLKEVEKAKVKHQEMIELVENYEVPDIGVYIETKTRLKELNKNLKILNRRNNIMKIILNSQVKIMMNLTGERKAKLSWFKEDITDQNMDEFNYEFVEDGGYLIETDKTLQKEFDIYEVLKK